MGLKVPLYSSTVTFIEGIWYRATYRDSFVPVLQQFSLVTAHSTSSRRTATFLYLSYEAACHAGSVYCTAPSRRKIPHRRIVCSSQCDQHTRAIWAFTLFFLLGQIQGSFEWKNCNHYFETWLYVSCVPILTAAGWMTIVCSSYPGNFERAMSTDAVDRP